MIDFEKITERYPLVKDLQLEDLQSILSQAQMKNFSPGEVLIQAGEKDKQIYFILKGLVRGFHTNERGEDITLRLRVEYQTLASPYATLFDQPARLTSVAIEPTTALAMDFDLLQTLVKDNAKLLLNQQMVLLELLRQFIQREESFILLSPEERYLEFVRTHPDILSRVPNKYVAHVLGITPVSLSRIRKRIMSRKSSS